ncbi:hypothetical protein EI77_00897 [Prosthecobacter fusiformis]|uniref:Uncharacterized protein n=1 Tax=Prosthecobacter fusiformis TaxID=48464 RepID=A0A4R7STH6_9BACT|nr:hypothetical protein EI77_00897 [Prosthecobacter fusiformis]
MKSKNSNSAETSLASTSSLLSSNQPSQAGPKSGEKVKWQIYCVNCGRVISAPVEELPVSWQVSEKCEVSLVPKGQFWRVHNFWDSTPDGVIVVHRKDVLDLNKHPDSNRHAGCCGEGGYQGPNLVCPCGNEVATEVSDCCTPHFIHFLPEATDIEHQPLQRNDLEADK